MEKKVYSLKTFRWGYFGRRVILPAFLAAWFIFWMSTIISQPQWHNASAEDMLELKNMEVVEVEAELGDSFWSLQNSVQTGRMWEFHEAFVALNPHYNGKVIEAGVMYVFVRYLDEK